MLTKPHATVCVFRSITRKKQRWLYQQNRAQLFRHAQAEDSEIEKRTFGGPYLEGTLQKPLIFLKLKIESGFRIQSRGRDNSKESILLKT
jgi:hypothetical protein